MRPPPLPLDSFTEGDALPSASDRYPVPAGTNMTAVRNRGADCVHQHFATPRLFLLEDGRIAESLDHQPLRDEPLFLVFPSK
jgi:hypothetical protein